MRLHGSIFIITGGAMIALSAYLISRYEANLLFFEYAGLIFIAIGAFKLVARWVLNGDRPIRRPQEGPEAQRAHQRLAQREEYLLCPGCQTANHRSNRFCRHCGMPLAARKLY